MAYTPSTGGGGSATTGNPFSNSAPSVDFDVISGVPTQIPSNADRGNGEHGLAMFPAPISSATSMLGDLSAMNVAQLAALQDKMIAAGLLPKTGRSGIPDAATRAAYTELLQTTSRMNAAGDQVTPNDVLDRAVQATSSLPGAQPQYSTALHQYTPTDPARVRLTAEAAFQTAIGKKPTQAQLDKFVAHFTGAEMSAQATGFNAADQIQAQAIGGAMPGAFTPSDANPGIAAKDWQLTQNIAGKYGVDPRLLVAIGQHETGWGKLGDGKKGNVLGVGSYDSGSSYKWAGLQNQLTEGAKLLAQHGVYSVQDVAAGKAKFWATDPKWAQGVVGAYQNLTGDQSSAASPAATETMDGKPVGGTVAERLKQMMAAAPGKISVASGTRSNAEQTKLYNDFKAGKGNLAAKPGTSKHEKGLAADLSFSSPAVRDWAHANAARFGLSFPIAGEAWHVEPIGATTAAPAAGLPPISQSVVVQQPDLAAQATEYAQNADPTETQAYGVGQQFDNFVNILKQGVI